MPGVLVKSVAPVTLPDPSAFTASTSLAALNEAGELAPK